MSLVNAQIHHPLLLALNAKPLSLLSSVAISFSLNAVTLPGLCEGPCRHPQGSCDGWMGGGEMLGFQAVADGGGAVGERWGTGPWEGGVLRYEYASLSH